MVILAWANGTGKTTLSRELLKEFNLESLNADDIADSISSDKSILQEYGYKLVDYFL